jgi:hypothetical protein
MSDVDPRLVLARVALAVPAAVRKRIVIVGSLAAGYRLLGTDRTLTVRTKDVDCALFPRVAAVQAGRDVAEELLAKGWRHRPDREHGRPGTAATPVSSLPAVRLFPPKSDDWFIELLTVPASEKETGKRWTRLELSEGHYGLPSFEFMSLAAVGPTKTEFGIYCARPEMMALALLLEHPTIKPETMSGLIEGRKIKRSNKDLGRVLAIARLSSEKAIVSWPAAWERACAPASRLAGGNWHARSDRACAACSTARPISSRRTTPASTACSRVGRPRSRNWRSPEDDSCKTPSSRSNGLDGSSRRGAGRRRRSRRSCGSKWVRTQADPRRPDRIRAWRLRSERFSIGTLLLWLRRPGSCGRSDPGTGEHKSHRAAITGNGSCGSRTRTGPRLCSQR